MTTKEKKTASVPPWLGGNAKVITEDPVHIDSGAFFFGNCRIGAYSYFGRGALIGSVRGFGRFCSIAPNVTIGLGEHPLDFISTHPAFFKAAGMFPGLRNVVGVDRTAETLSFPPTIGNDVWIGANSIISRGIRIGNGAVIGAGAFVNGDVPDYAIVVGQPARVVRFRFETSIIERLNNSCWWDFQPDLMTGIAVNRVEEALEEIEKRVSSGNYPKAAYAMRNYGG